MSTTFCITTYENRLCGCLLKDNRLFQLQFFSSETSLLGNIYIGKVKNILKNIDAAFVEIAGGQTCFLPLSEAENPVLTNRVYANKLVNGDEILVQVKKDAVKTKDPVLTAQLSFPGRYVCVNADGKKKVQYSHKLKPQIKQQVYDVLADVSLPEHLSLVIRTEANDLEDFSVLKKEAKDLLIKAEQTFRIGRTRTVYSRLNDHEPSYLRMLRELGGNTPDKIMTDLPDVYTTLQLALKDSHPELLSGLVLYRDESLSLSGLYGLQARIENALSRQIWLKSGGYLVIEPTEALIVIDVNSGKYTGKKTSSETFYLINKEAAEEIAIQLSVRNLSGIILVDFINMDSKEQEEELLAYFSELLKQDPVTTCLIDMTPLGLVEITRKKVRMNLQEQLSSR